jgi:acetolactate synthase-1/2/3 large subunit
MCLNCDGGIMMNLQELQTIVHYNLPIKIFVFMNDGYLMIKNTQNAMLSGRKVAVDKNSGVSVPDFSKVANAFGIPSYKIYNWEDVDNVVPLIQNTKGPVLCEVFMHPEQLMVPKLAVGVKDDGTLVSPPLEDLSPFLPREELEKNMIVGLHTKSKGII